MIWEEEEDGKEQVHFRDRERSLAGLGCLNLSGVSFSDRRVEGGFIKRFDVFLGRH